MIELYSPGIGYYAHRIRHGPSFAFVRYGEGEWKTIVSDIPLQKKSRLGRNPDVRAAFQRTIIKCHQNDNYKVALWHQEYFIHVMRRQAELEAWIKRNVPAWVKWYDGRIWRATVEQGQLYPLIRAMREQKLPIILVGPQRIARRIGIPVTQHIVTHPKRVWQERKRIEKEILKFGRPALVAFSASGATKILIHNLWPAIGQHSYLIDFGAMWDGLCGFKTRPFHRRLTPALIRKNLEGK